MNIADLDTAIRNVCPIYGISIGDISNKLTWRIDFDPTALQAEKDAAQLVVDGWDINAAVVPKEVTMRQARLALSQQNLLTAVETAVTNAGGYYKIEWDYSSMVQRNKASVISMATAVGLTSQQLDDLFILAATL